MHPDLYAKCIYWESNDGDGLNAEDSAELGRRLLSDVASGQVTAYAAMRDDDLPHEGPISYPFDQDNIKQFAAFLVDCGGFEIY
jgi:hypothetical protein